jgi:hypothetical protein
MNQRAAARTWLTVLAFAMATAAALDAAKALIDADPGVTSGIFTYRIAPLRVFYPWQP